MQTIIGSLMLWMSFTVQDLMDNVCNLVSMILVLPRILIGGVGA